MITFFVTQLLRRFWTDSRDFGTNGQLSTMTRSYQGHFLEFPLRDRSVPEVSLPETNTSKDAFFQKKKKSEEDYLGNRDSEMKKCIKKPFHFYIIDGRCSYDELSAIAAKVLINAA